MLAKHGVDAGQGMEISGVVFGVHHGIWVLGIDRLAGGLRWNTCMSPGRRSDGVAEGLQHEHSTVYCAQRDPAIYPISQTRPCQYGLNRFFSLPPFPFFFGFSTTTTASSIGELCTPSPLPDKGRRHALIKPSSPAVNAVRAYET